MKFTKLAIVPVLLVGTLGLTAVPAAADGVLFKTRVQGTNYCHMKFPAIREGTLSWDQPVLQSANSGDIVDFYGPCDHNPSGQEEARAQKRFLKTGGRIMDNN